MKYLLAIAIEEYSDPKLGRVLFALEDANGLIAALEQHGYEDAGQYILLNEDATKTLIESRLRRLARVLTPDDELVAYFAGHGFSVAGRNMLAAWDTQYADIEHTAIQMADILKLLRDADCGRVTMFLDACHTGVEIDPVMRGVHAELSDDELREFFDESEYCVCFAACKSDESSYSSRALKHGIWTYHLLEALNGNANLATERKVLVTSNSLQNYLKKEVPRTISTTFTDGRTQTPWMFGGASGEFVVADITSILAARKVKPASEAVHLPRVSFKAEESMPIKRLSGFRQGHHVPKTVDSYTESFVAKVGSPDVEEDVNLAYSNIRDSMGYKRRDLTKSYDGGSVGSIVTPDFDYNVRLQQNQNSADEALLLREVTHIRNPSAVLSDEFQSAFPDTFDTIEFSAVKDIDVIALIDHVEEHEPDVVTLTDYDDDGSFCNIRVDGINGKITVTPDSIKIVSVASAPRELAQLFTRTWNALLPATPSGMLQLPDGTKPSAS